MLLGRAGLLVVALALSGCPSYAPPGVDDDVLERLRPLAPPALPPPPPDLTNRFADREDAARLGQQLFFDPRFSGPLLDSDNDGLAGTLGRQGDTGRVSCASCHLPESDFLDTRSVRLQISLASGWTRRRTPSLLDFGQHTLLMWDGRRDTGYNQIFGVIESPLEYNSSRLFVAQQIARHYRVEYDAVFGPLPSLDAYELLAPEQAGCEVMPADPLVDRCHREGHDDPAVIEIVVNAGKAIAAYERQLECGPSRFDAWMHGDPDALSAEEQAGAAVFVRAGCDRCHSGPYLTDGEFHNVGASNTFPLFIGPYEDPGASAGLAGALVDPLNSRGTYSDGDDGRLDRVPADARALLGAFRTPSLRCVSRRPSFMHAGQLRSLADVVLFFDRGGDGSGYLGTKDPRVVPLGLTRDEREQLVAFLRALDGPGARPELIAAPTLP